MINSNIDAMLSAIPDPATQQTLKGVFRYLLTGTIRFGRATGSTAQSAASTSVPSQSLGGGWFMTTTPANANTEFAIQHNYGHPPYLLIAGAPLDQVGAAIVRLTVSRAADANNVYLKSPETSQPIYVYLEG